MVNIVGVVFLCGLALISAAQSKEEDVLQELQGIKKLRSLGLEIAGHLQSLNQDDLNVLDSRLPTQDDLLCLSDLAALVAGLQGGQFWALKSKLTLESRKSYFYDQHICVTLVFDAWGSIPSGLLTGNIYDLGNFDECLNIKKETSLGRTIQGKFCFLSVSPAKMLGLNNTILGTFRTGTCLPASCSAAQMNTFVGQMVKQLLNVSIPSTAMSIRDSTCQTSESEPWDGLTIFMM